jgi:hypothetical protein
VAPAKKAAEVDPNKLKRERAGRYVTPDGRFAVEGPSTNGWYIVDGQRENELGLPLMAGPFATLDEAKAEVANLRSGTGPAPQPAPTTLHLVPSGGGESKPGRAAGEAPTASTTPKLAAPPAKAAPGRTPAAPAEAAAPAEPAWLERLAAPQQADARRLLALLDRLGIDDPSLVRRELEANEPEVSRALLAREVRRLAVAPWEDPDDIERELASVEKGIRRHLRPTLSEDLDAAERAVQRIGASDDLAAFARLVALRTAAGIFEALDLEGRDGRATGEPGWRLLELDGRREPTDRAIVLEVSDLLDAPEA